MYMQKNYQIWKVTFLMAVMQKNVLFTFQKELMMIIGFLNLVILRTS